MAQTDTSTDAALPDLTGAGDELYDQIMGGIEPELMTDQLPLLKDKYAAETPEQAKERAERYNAAFEEYDRQFAVYQENWNAQLAAYKRSALASTENDARAEEAAQLQVLEQNMSSL